MENPATRCLSFEMPVACVFGVIVHLRCYGIWDVLSVASSHMVISLCLKNRLGNPLT